MSPRDLLASAQLLRREERWLRRLALDLTRDRELAEDLVQETFITALERPPASPGPLRPWLAGVLRNLYRMAARASARRSRRELAVEMETESPPPDRALEAASVARALLDEIDRLSEPYQSTIRLRYYEGLEPAQIARQLGIPAATVRKRNQLALAHLRARLDRRLGRGGKLREALASAFLAPSLPSAIPGRRPPPAPPLGAPRAGPRARARLPGGPFRGSGSLGGRVGGLAGAGAVGVWLAAALVPGSTPRAPLQAPRASGERPAQGEPAPRPAADPLAAAARASAPPQPAVAADRDAPARAVELQPAGCPSLAAEVEAAPPRAVLQVPPCLFREEIVVRKPITLVGAPGAEIRGSDVFSFEARGAVWESREGVPDWGERAAPGPGEADEAPGAVYRDGLPLVRVAGRPGPGEFALGPGRRIHLGEDPTGHVVEVTVRRHWLRIEASDVTVRGFRMRHAASGRAALLVGGAPGTVRGVAILGNELRDASGPLLRVGGSRHRVEGNELAESGWDALVVGPGQGTVVRGNRIHHNGPRGLGRWTWRGAGVTTIAHPALVEENEIHDNRGAAIFLVNSSQALVRRNALHDNWGSGVIVHEGERARIEENRLWRNGWQARPPEAAIFVSSARGAQVSGNTLAFHPFGVRVMPTVSDHAGFDLCYDTTRNAINDNVLIASGDEASAVSFLDPGQGTRARPTCANRSERNRLWSERRSEPEPGAAVHLPLSEDDKRQVLATARIPERR